ncbi:zf-HC2 domain-containing protein [Streptomyces sp. B-S-A8]|uniref:Zf-HC2 domain-containing protein n=1 Tax=Streptomyces solicavernae TaxID=3043614 RepID=A0ABT6RY71_9ACTN|nr:zf-HC2 domain-containing protein [Streptomyces sp. B-S-A8]MDI3389384.1 zf-HC2 domain-containing protein [Streptomyces sp. B-S-A8]
MNAYGGPGPQGFPAGESVHEPVGAYALGLLDERETAAFEAHLAQCAYCVRELGELAGVEPMLAALAADGVPAPPRQPGRRLLDGLLAETARERTGRRRRSRLLLAAAAALIVAAPLAALAATGEDHPGTRTPEAHPTSPAQDAFFHHIADKVAATDPASDVTATVGTEAKPWGTHTVLELKNVKGPLKCRLVAVGRNGEEETVTSWSVPERGYGIEDSPHPRARTPLYVHGGAAMERSDIDRFEVRTFDGRRLVEVDA